MKKLTFFKDYQQEVNKRASFDALSIKTFSLSFETWYQSGYWRDYCIPYTLFDGEQAVANVSANIMDFSIFDHQRRTIQIGTVMTDEAYRNQGLSRRLIEKVLDDWKTESHLIYLFANSSVWNFYPKLGFEPVKEYQYQRSITPVKTANYIKLDMTSNDNREKLHDYARNTCQFGQIAMQENADLVMFYCISVYKDNVFYLPDLDAIAVAELNGKQLYLLDVFSKKEQGLEDIILALSDEAKDLVRLGFTPKDCSGYEIVPIDETVKDEMLFVESGKTALFKENQLMFPVLSHA